MPIRTLKSGEPIPPGEPRRYPRPGRGYVRLRWHGVEGPGQHVEVYEHRVCDGFVVDDPEVHHRNGHRDDNTGSNLAGLTKAQHRAEHRTIDRAEAARLYGLGSSTTKVGAELGCSGSAVSRLLRAEGIQPRSVSEGRRSPVDESAVRAAHAEGLRAPGIAEQLHAPLGSVRRVLRDLGLSCPPGRPPTRG